MSRKCVAQKVRLFLRKRVFLASPLRTILFNNEVDEHEGNVVMGRIAVMLAGASLCAGVFSGQAAVRVEETTVTLPTYPPGPYDKTPVFYTGRVYQGAQGRVYPYPLQDVLRDEKVDKTYTSLRLENEYLEMSVLPEIGGRMFSFTDKESGF